MNLFGWGNGGGGVSVTEAPKYITISNPIGRGQFKTAYDVVETSKTTGECVFLLPSGKIPSKLCIVNMESANNSLQNLVDEINIHREFYRIGLAPQIHLIQLFNDDRIITLTPDDLTLQTTLTALSAFHNTFFEFYILEDKCGISIFEYMKNTEPNEALFRYIFPRIMLLIENCANNGKIVLDIKPDNTCSHNLGNELSQLQLLDFDARFFINFPETQDLMKANAIIFMKTLFFSKLAIDANIYYESQGAQVPETYMKMMPTPDEIKSMILYFINDKSICKMLYNPINMLYHYTAKLIFSKDKQHIMSCDEIFSILFNHLKLTNPTVEFNEKTKDRDLNGMVDIFVMSIIQVVTPRPQGTRGGSKKRKSRKYKKKKSQRKKVPRTHKK